MKKVLLLIILLILPLVNAAEIFNDEITDNIPFRINGVEHVARYYPAAKKVSILAGEDRALVKISDCQDIGELKYCIDSATKGIDDDTGDPTSTMNLRVIESGPDISINRGVSTDEPNIEEEISVTATVTNNGNERAINIVYEDKYPSNVKITGTNINSVTNSIVWSGSLGAGESQTIKYNIRFKTFKDYSSTATTQYLFNNDIKKSKSEVIDFMVKKPYALSDFISRKSVKAGEEIKYTVSINATGQDLNVNKFSIELPEGSIVTKKDLGFTESNGKQVFSTTLLGTESTEMSITFKSSKIGKHKITTSTDLRAGSESFTETTSHDVGIGISDISPQIIFTPDSVKGGQEVEISAYIINNGEDTISDIELNMASNIVDARGWRHIELAPGKKQNAITKIINAPASDEDKTYFIKLSGSFERPSGGTMDYEETAELQVLAQQKLVELKPIVKIDGDEVNVTLKVKNVATYGITFVSLIDTFPKGFKTIKGEQYIDIEEIGIGEEITAYSYVVKVPESFKGDEFEITHIFNGIDNEEDKMMTEKMTTVTLSKTASTEESSNETETDETNISESGDTTKDSATESEESKKPGIIKRIWGWFKGLFSKDAPSETNDTPIDANQENTT